MLGEELTKFKGYYWATKDEASKMVFKSQRFIFEGNFLQTQLDFFAKLSSTTPTTTTTTTTTGTGTGTGTGSTNNSVSATKDSS